MLKFTFQLSAWYFSTNFVTFLHLNSSRGPVQRRGDIYWGYQFILQVRGKPWSKGLGAVFRLADILADLQCVHVHKDNQSPSFFSIHFSAWLFHTSKQSIICWTDLFPAFNSSIHATKWMMLSKYQTYIMYN